MKNGTCTSLVRLELHVRRAAVDESTIVAIRRALVSGMPDDRARVARRRTATSAELADERVAHAFGVGRRP